MPIRIWGPRICGPIEGAKHSELKLPGEMRRPRRGALILSNRTLVKKGCTELKRIFEDSLKSPPVRHITAACNWDHAGTNTSCGAQFVPGSLN